MTAIPAIPAGSKGATPLAASGRHWTLTSNRLNSRVLDPNPEMLV